MFSALLTKLTNLIRRAAAPVDCPACGHHFKPGQDREFTHWREMLGRFPCPKCGHKFGVGEDAASLADNPPGPARMPHATRITREQPSPDELIFLLPPGSRGMARIVFGALLCSVILPLCWFIVVKGGGFGADANVPRVIISLMALASLFVFIGGIQQRLETFAIQLLPDFVWVKRRLFIVTTKHLPTTAIESVRRAEEYRFTSGSEDAGQTVHKTHAIELRAGLKFIRFGSGLTEDEQHWLAWEIREYLRAHGATALPAELVRGKKAR